MECAERLIAEFGSLAATLGASRARLARALQDRPDVVEALTTVRLAMLHALQGRLFGGPVLSNGRVLAAYLRAAMAYEPAEQVRVLYLSSKNALLSDEVAALGSIDGATVYPREIVRRALELGAAGLVIAHNHPSGDPTPSAADVAVTQRLAGAARAFDIALHDHIVVGRSGTASMRTLGLL